MSKNILFKADIDLPPKGRYPHFLVLGIMMVIGILFFFAWLGKHTVDPKFFTIWKYSFFVVLALEFLFLEIRLPSNRILLKEKEGEIWFEVWGDVGLEKELLIDTVDFWWSYYVPQSARMDEPSFLDDEGDWSENSQMEGRGPSLPSFLFVELSAQDGKKIYLYEALNVVQEVQRGWRFQQQKSLDGFIGTYQLSKFITILRQESLL